MRGYGGHRLARLSMSSTLLKLDGPSLTIWGAREVASGRRVAWLSKSAAKRVRGSRVLKRELLGREIPICGVTDEFGAAPIA
jgi:histidine ammonia-lyase